MRDRQTCIGCSKKSPETETNYTLISAQFGWRLSRYSNPDGTIIIEWRCPSCWREYKKAKDLAASSTGADPTRDTPPPRSAVPDSADAASSRRASASDPNETPRSVGARTPPGGRLPSSTSRPPPPPRVERTPTPPPPKTNRR